MSLSSFRGRTIAVKLVGVSLMLFLSGALNACAQSNSKQSEPAQGSAFYANVAYPKGYPPKGPISIGTVPADCSGTKSANEVKFTYHLMSCFLKNVAEIQVDEIESATEAKTAFGYLVDEDFLNNWDSLSHIALGRRENYTPIRMEGVSYSRSLRTKPQWAIYGYVVFSNGTNEYKKFYLLEFSGVNSYGNLVLSKVMGERELLKTYR